MDVKETPFVLIARVKVKPGKVENYLQIAEEGDKAVEKSEPGMLCFIILILIPRMNLNSYGQKYTKMMMPSFFISIIHQLVNTLKNISN